MCCKTYCFAFQKRRFCTVKAALLRCKTAAFTVQLIKENEDKSKFVQTC